MTNQAKDFSEILIILSSDNIAACSTLKQECFLEESFMSEARWELSDQQAYLISVFRNMTPTPFVIVDVESCLNAAKEENRRVDIEYFESVPKKKITCDSNNRQMCLFQAIVENIVPLPVGNFRVSNNTMKIEANTYWEPDSTVTLEFPKGKKGLSQNHRSLILMHRRIPIQTVKSATRQDLADLFDAVNKGVVQNAQEIRQSWYSDFGQPIRDLARKIKPMYIDGKILTKKETDRRLVDEFLVDFCHYLYLGFDEKYTKPTRDKYYVEFSPITKFVSEVEKVFQQLEIPKVGKTPKGKKLSAETTQRAIAQNVFLRLWLGKNSYKIKDSKEFDSWVYALDAKFMATSPTILEGKEKKEKVRNPECPHFRNDEGIEYPYKSAGRRNVDFMEWNFNLFLESLMKEKLDLIVDIDPQRLATPEQKYQVWLDQQGKTPDGITKIPLEELLDHSKWQADHIIRHTDGGQTTLANLQIISTADNLAKANIPSIPILF